MIKGVLFDMDGVILDSERAGQDIYLSKSHEWGYTKMNEQIFSLLLGKSKEEDARILHEALGDDFPSDELYDFCREERFRRVTTGELGYKPGVKECFEGLRQRGIKIALATSTARDIVKVYQQHLPEMQQFEYMVCGAEAGRSKPAPDVFLKAAEGLGLDITECIGVEDSLAGLQSQTAAGCVRVLVPDLLPCDERFDGLWDYCLPTLHDLCGLIDRLNGEETHA